MASPYDRLLGIPQTEEQGSTYLTPAEGPPSLFPQRPAASNSLLPVSGTAAPAPPADLIGAPGGFLTVDNFFNSPGYKSALLPEKQDLEKQYARTFLTPARMKAVGATQQQQADASADFNKRRAKVEKGSVWDTDLLDMPAYGLANAVGGAARVLGFDGLADSAAADAERIRKEMFSPETRYKLEQEQYEAKKLAKKHGGEDNVPWWSEVVQGVSNFTRQPLNKTLQAIGSGAPALAAAVVPGGAGVSLTILTSALLTAGDSASGAYDKIMAMPEPALQNSIEYVEARANGETHEQARRTVADRAVREAAMLAAPLGAAGGAFGARFGAEALVRGAKGIIGKTAGEMASEGIEEGLGTVIQNEAVQRADPAQPLSTGAFSAAAEGAMAGGGLAVGSKALTAVPVPNMTGRSGPTIDPEAATVQPENPTGSPAAAAQDDVPDDNAETALQQPAGTWGDPTTTGFTNAAPASDPAAPAASPATGQEYAVPPAPSRAAAENDAAAATALKSLFSAVTPEAQQESFARAIPGWIRTDPTANNLLVEMGTTDPSTEPEEFSALRDELIARVAYMQASENARWTGAPDPSGMLRTLAAGNVRDRFLPSFVGALWTQDIQRAFARYAKLGDQADVAKRPSMATTTAPAAPPPATPAAAAPPTSEPSAPPAGSDPGWSPRSALDEYMREQAARGTEAPVPDGTPPPLEGQVLDGRDAYMYLKARRPVRLPDATVSSPSAPPAAAPAASGSGRSFGGSGLDQQAPTRRTSSSPPASAPLPDTPTAPVNVKQQETLAEDLTKQWRVPTRKSRAKQQFDENALTEPITNDERILLRNGKPIEALRSIAERNGDSVLGEFAKDLIRTVAQEVNTQGGREALRTVTARYRMADNPGNPGGRGSITIGDGLVSTHAVLHEFAHALTVARIRNPITAAQKSAVAQLTRQMEWVAANLPPAHPVRQSVVMGALSNPAEFAAEVYTNPVLQNYLKSIPSSAVQNRRKTRSNLWDQFIDAVTKLMKLRGTALMDTLMTLREIDDGRINKEVDASRAWQETGATGQAGATAGSGETGSGPAGAGSPAEATSDPSGSDAGTAAQDVSGGPDNRELPDERASPSAGDGATGEDPRDPITHAGDPDATGPTGTVADVAMSIMADLSNEQQAELLALAATIGLTPDELLTEVARRGVGDIRKLAPDLAKTLDTAIKGMDLYAQSPLLMKAQTALDAVISSPAHIRRYEDLLKFAATGESPRVDPRDQLWAKMRERFIDSSTPFLRAIGWNQGLTLWKKLKRAGSKLQEENKVLNEQFAHLNTAINQFAKANGISVDEAFNIVDRYTMSRYVANGANEELHQHKLDSYNRASATLARLQKAILKEQGINPNSTKLKGMRTKANNLQKIVRQSLSWKSEYDRVNDLVRGRDRDINGASTDRQPDHRFIGGMTRQEAKEVVDGIKQRMGPAMAGVDQLADSIVDLHRFWANRALNFGLFVPVEAAQWPQNKFKGGSGDYYVPITGNDNLKDQEEAYGIGGVFYKDFAEEGRENIGNGAYMSVAHFATSMARRIANNEFMKDLYENAKVGRHGFAALGATDPVPKGNSRSFFYKEQLPNGNPLVHKIILNNEEAADALVGANRAEIESTFLKGMAGTTNLFGFMVTQATLMFGPINAFRDLGEKTYTMIAKYGDVDKAKFLASTAANLANVDNWRAAIRFAFGAVDNSQAGKELREFADLGGLNTRTGTLNREAGKIISEIRKQSPGFRQLGQLKEAIGKYNEAWEIMSALVSYRALKASSNVPVDETAFRMLDAMNFGQSGTVSPFLKMFYLFFNPTVQGARNTYNTMLKDITQKTPAGKRARRTAMVVLAASFGLYAFAKAFGGEDDDYGNRTDNLATSTVSRNIPIWIGDDKYLRVPVPFGAPAVLWNIAVGLSRFSSGTMTAPDAAFHILQGTAEHTVPFPISQVDFAKDPAFWAMKTFIPQVLGPIVNIGSGKDDFGNDLYKPRSLGDRHKPDTMLGKRNTPEAWKELAAGLGEAGVGDFRPETIKEATRLLFVGPTEAMAQWALGVKKKTGDDDYLKRIVGLNRVHTSDPRGLYRAYYTAEQKVSDLLSQVYATGGDRPKNLRGDARKTALAGWIASSNLTQDEQQIVSLYMNYEERLKKANSEKSTEEPEEVMRQFLREYRAITNE